MYKVRMELILSDVTLSNTIYGRLETELKKHGKVINAAIVEKSYLELELCHHDESPPRPCEIIKRIESA